MKELFKNVLKAAVTMFAVGALMGLAAPAVGSMLGASVIGESAVAYLSGFQPVATGLAFGLFGAFSAVVTPVINHMFGDGKAASATEKSAPEKLQAPSLSQEHEHAVSTSCYRDRVSASKRSMGGCAR